MTSSPILFSVNGIREASEISTYAWSGNGCRLPWSFTWCPTQCYQSLQKFPSFNWNGTRWRLQHHLLLDQCRFLIHNIFIQSSTVHDRVSSAHWNLAFFSWGLRDGFCLAFLYRNPVSLQFSHIVSDCFFVVHFLFLRPCFAFFCPDALTRGLPVRFPFTTSLFCWLTPNLRHSWLGTTKIFYQTPCRITFVKEFNNPFPFVSTDRALVRAVCPFSRSGGTARSGSLSTCLTAGWFAYLDLCRYLV